MCQNHARDARQTSRPAVARGSAGLLWLRPSTWTDSGLESRRLAPVVGEGERHGRTRFGATITVNGSDIVGRDITFFGTWEPNLTASLSWRLSPGDTFVDVGANVGHFTLLASRLVGPTDRAVAVEPSPANLTLLTRNAASNRARNVQIVAAAASETAGALDFYGDGVTAYATLHAGWAASRSLSAIGVVPVAPAARLADRRRTGDR